jgi:RNA polymerase sigma-70 factor (ECF subfamily)
MFEDEIVSAQAPSVADSAKPSPLEQEVVALFDQHRDRLLRYLLSLGLSTPDSEEVIQEVFLALFRHLQRGKPRDNLRAWLFQVAHNLALKERHRQNRVEYGEASRLVDREPNPEDQLARTQQHVRLQSVLRALPEQDRRCLVLRAEGLTYREIAQVLDMSLGAVSVSLTRSLARFARAEER